MKMRIILMISSVALIFTTSCGEQELNLDKYDTIKQTSDEYAYQQSIGEWFNPEVKYSNNSADTNIDSDRIYFSVTNRSDEKIDMWAYVSSETGEKHYLCPDPLCTHTSKAGCKYLGLVDLIIDPVNNQQLYSTKQIYNGSSLYYAICKVNISNDTVDEIYSSTSDDDIDEIYRLDFVAGEYLYFTIYRHYQLATNTGEIEKKSETIWSRLNLKTYEVTEINNFDDSAAVGCIMADDQHLFYIDQSSKKFYTTDLNGQNEQVVMTFLPGYQISDYFYDASEDTFYILVTSDYMFRDSEYEILNGDIYRITTELEVQKLELPTEKVTSFYMTNNYIYYTQYDPIEYGASPRGGNSSDNTGGKLYRVPRNDLQNAELIFDGKGEIPICGEYWIVGDNLYLDYYHVMDEGGMSWFRRMGSTLRVNFVNDTICWLNLE